MYFGHILLPSTSLHQTSISTSHSIQLHSLCRQAFPVPLKLSNKHTEAYISYKCMANSLGLLLTGSYLLSTKCSNHVKHSKK